MASTTTIINTRTMDITDLPSPVSFDDFDDQSDDFGGPSDFLADTFGFPQEGPQDNEHSNHIRTAIISSVILGLGFIALVGALLFVFYRRRQRTRYFSEGEEVTKEGMALQSVDSFAVVRDGSAVDLRGGAGSFELDALTFVKKDGEGGDKLEVPPPTYEEVVQAPAPASHHRVSEGAVVRRGEEQGVPAVGAVADGRRPTSEQLWEETERLERGSGEMPSVGTREFI